MADSMDIESADEDGRLYLNGIDALTGLPAVPPMTEEEAARRAAGGPPPAEDVGLLRRLWEALKRPFHGLPDDIDPTDVATAGWAVVLPTETPDEVRQAIERLVAHRRDHTRVPADRCRILDYRPGQSLGDWLRGLGAHLADVEPTRLPYYVALVGGPEVISFEFQALLDMNYAVGRIAFDRPEQYRQYVEGLIAYETAGAVPNGREVLYWGPRNRADRATQLSADCLIRPLFEGIPATGDQPALPADRRAAPVPLPVPRRPRGDAGQPAGAAARRRAGPSAGVPVHRLARAGVAQRAREPGGRAGGAALPGLARPGRAAPLGALREGRRHRRRRAGSTAWSPSCSPATGPGRRPSTSSWPTARRARCRSPGGRSWRRCRSGCCRTPTARRWPSSATSSGPGATRSGPAAWARGCGRSATCSAAS